MKRLFLKLLCICLLAISLTGCNSHIDTVRNGVLDLDKSTTVGKAFDNYSYFKKTSWSEFETKQGKIVVQFEGILDFDKLASGFDKSIHDKWIYDKYINYKNTIEQTNPSIIVQFIINKDDTFNINYTGISINDKNEPIGTYNINNIYNDEKVGAFIAALGMLDRIN